MKIAVLGATGLTGAQVVEQALANGHTVTALVRNPDTVTRRHPHLVVRKGSPVSPADIAACVAGADAVVHCLGIGGLGTGAPTTLVSDSVKAVLAEMQLHGVRRLVCMSNMGTGDSGSWLVRRVVPVVVRRLRPILEDKERMEAALRASDVEWVAVRMAAITKGPAKPVRTSADGRGLGLSVTAASAAAFLLARTQGPEFLRETPSLSN